MRSKNVTLKTIDKKWMVTEVCAMDMMYAVVYEGKMVRASKYNDLTNNPQTYYYTMFYQYKGYADAAARKFNNMFNTTKFNVIEVKTGG